MFLASSKIYPIGLDISDLGIKLVQLKKAGDNIKFQAWGKVDLEKGFVSGGKIIKKQEVLNSIKQLISKPKFGSVTSNEVVASLPETKTFIKLIKIDKSPNQIADIIENEIEKHFPVSAKEIYYDWQTIKTRPDSFDILVGAAPKLIVNQYVNLLQEAKLSIKALEIESAAICRSLLKEESKKGDKDKTKNYCLIDIGATRASIIIYAKNSIALTMSLPISSDEITQKIAQTLEIKKDQAEKAKIICGFDKSQAHGIINDILLDMVNKLTNKIKKVLEFYNNEYPQYDAIDEILLCGGGANIKKIDAAISQSTAIKTSLASPFINLGKIKDSTTKNFTEIHQISPDNNQPNKPTSLKQNAGLTYATAIGLALRGIFIPKI